MKRFLPLLIFLNLFISCRESGPFIEGKVFAGKKYVSAKTLNLGYTTYQEYCFACHGIEGDGNGVASKGLVPPPRNFKQGLFKFGNVEDGGLPTDEDLYRIVRKGLKGSAMLPWDISDERLDAVVQYIKTFAPEVWEGEDKEVGTPIVATRDPFKSRKDYALERGKEVYHIVANCQSCHRAYVSGAEYKSLYKKVEGEEVSDLDEEMYVLKPQESEYDYKAIPPDFTWHELRTINSVEDIYLRLSAGINGSGMPAWKGVLEDDDIWAVSYYVESLSKLKGTPEREVFLDKLK